MKHCSRCNLYKIESEFRKNKQKSDGLQSICSECNKLLNRLWYAKNKRKKIKATRLYRQKNVEWLLEYKKTLKCKLCPENHPRCLDFHHKDPIKKHLDISRAVRTWGLSRLKKEITKCEVLCSNCHRKETFSDDYI